MYAACTAAIPAQRIQERLIYGGLSPMSDFTRVSVSLNRFNKEESPLVVSKHIF